MYRPAYAGESRTEVMHGMIRRVGLGTLVVAGPEGLTASHVPFLLIPDRGPFGVLQAHLARPNPLWRAATTETEALAVFLGPQAYISPSWYATKQATGKAVPTWDYAAVHAHGRLRAIEDRAWLLDHLTRLTDSQESAFPEPWRVDDAPPEFIDGLLKGIVGVELVVERLEGSWKMSQNRPAEDRAGVVGGLRARGDEESRAVAELVENASPNPHQ